MVSDQEVGARGGYELEEDGELVEEREDSRQDCTGKIKCYERSVELIRDRKVTRSLETSIIKRLHKKKEVMGKSKKKVCIENIKMKKAKMTNDNKENNCKLDNIGDEINKQDSEKMKLVSEVEES